MEVTIRYFGHKITDSTRDVPTLAHARGIAKRTLRNSPFTWVSASVFYTDGDTKRVVEISKFNQQWKQVERIL